MRGRHRNPPSKPKPKPETKPKPKPETRGQRVAKALKTSAEGLKPSAGSGDAGDAAGAAELTALRVRKQRSTPGKAQSIIKNRRV